MARKESVRKNKMATSTSEPKGTSVLPETSGSADKDMAVAADSAAPKLKTVTPEGADWLNRDSYGLKTPAIYGQRNRFALRYEDLTRRAQFLARPLTVTDLEELHSIDETAPAKVDCTTCGKAVTSFVRTAMINDEGDLFRDQNENVIYRGQFVVTGRPLAIHAAHTGDCLYKLRDNLGRKKDLPNGREVANLLASQSFDQANARLAGIQGHFSAVATENQEFKKRLGFKVGDAAHSDKFPTSRTRHFVASR